MVSLEGTMDDELDTPEDFDPQLNGVDPPECRPIDRERKNIWLSKKLVRDLEDIVTEDDSNLTVVIRQALQHYVRCRKEGKI